MASAELKNIFESKVGIPLGVFSSFALSDAKHDFHGKLEVKVEDMKYGLPSDGGKNSNAITEDKILDLILGHNAELLKNGKLDLKDKLPDVSNEEKPPLPFTVEIKEQGKTIYQGDKYTGVRFAPKNYKGDAQGYHICERTKMCPNGNAIIVVDFNLKFTAHLKKGKSAGPATYNIHYAFTPEVVNDPAPKTPPEDKLFQRVDESKSNGVIFHSYVQTEPSPTIYDTYDEVTFPDKFFLSKYTFQLSPIKAHYKKNSAPKYTTDLVINWTDEKNKPHNATIVDSKDANSIQTLVGSVNSFIRGIGSMISSLFSGKKSNEYLFNYNSRLQQKRGGDWFQALCCHSVYNREFTKILPETNREHRKFFERGDWPVYFVSHDRIAVAYALLMGVNVIYTDYEQGVCVFKNTKSVASAGEKPIHILIKDTLSPVISANGGRSLYNDSQIAQIEFYNNSRAQILNEYENAVRGFFTASHTYKTKERPDATKTMDQLIRDDLFSDLYRNDVNREGAVIGQTLRILRLTDSIKFISAYFENLFRAIVMYVFAANNLVDLTPDYGRVTDPATIRLITSELSGDLDPDTVQKITAFNDAYKRINGIMRNFEMDTSDPENSKTRIKNWVETFMKKDIYKSVKLVSMIEDKEIFDKERVRLIDYNENRGAGDKRLADRFLFLPFVSSGISNEFKRYINGYFDLIATELKQFLLNPEISGRSNQVKPVFSYVNTLANFMIEARILLPIEPEPTTGAASASAAATGAALQVTEAAAIEHFNSPEELQKEEDMFFINDRIQQILFELDGFLSENFFSEDEIMYEELMEIEALKTGKKGIEDIDFESEQQGGGGGGGKQRGGKTSYFNRGKPRYNNIICSMSSINHTRPLLTYILSRNVSPIIQNYLMFDDHQRTFEETMRVEMEAQNKKRIASPDSSAAAAEEPAQQKRRIVKTRRGGAGGSAAPIFNETFGPHPLLPIYLILSAVWFTAEPNWESQSYLWDYVAILQKIATTLQLKYLSGDSVEKIYEAYIIGFALKVLFFTAHTKHETSDFIAANVLGISEDDYRLFSLCNSGFASYVAGSFYQRAEDVALAQRLLGSAVVKDFLTKDVRLPEMIQRMNSSVERGALDIQTLNNSVFSSISKIVSAVRHHHSKNVGQQMKTVSKAVSAPILSRVSATRQSQRKSITAKKYRSLSLKRSSTKRKNTPSMRKAWSSTKRKSSTRKVSVAMAPRPPPSRKSRKITKRITAAAPAAPAAMVPTNKRMFPTAAAADMFGISRKPTAAIAAAAAGGGIR